MGQAAGRLGDPDHRHWHFLTTALSRFTGERKISSAPLLFSAELCQFEVMCDVTFYDDPPQNMGYPHIFCYRLYSVDPRL